MDSEHLTSDRRPCDRQLPGHGWLRHLSELFLETAAFPQLVGRAIRPEKPGTKLRPCALDVPLRPGASTPKDCPTRKAQVRARWHTTLAIVARKTNYPA